MPTLIFPGCCVEFGGGGTLADVYFFCRLLYRVREGLSPLAVLIASFYMFSCSGVSSLGERNCRQKICLVFPSTVSISERPPRQCLSRRVQNGGGILPTPASLYLLVVHVIALYCIVCARCQVATVALGSAAVVTQSHQFYLSFQATVSSSGGALAFFVRVIGPLFPVRDGALVSLAPIFTCVCS